MQRVDRLRDFRNKLRMADDFLLVSGGDPGRILPPRPSG